MTELLRRILTDEASRRELFPVVRDRTFLAHASASPLPQPVVDAASGWLTRAGAEGQFDSISPNLADDTRRLAAQMLNVRADEIAFSPSTSASLGLVAAAMRWHYGDRVVVLEGDFPSALLPWYALRPRGVDVVEVAYRDTPVTAPEVLAHVDERTRLVVVSTTHFATGRPVADLSELGRALRERGVLLMADAIQSLGTGPIDASQVDLLAADGHKWLLAPAGMGILYVRREVLDTLTVPLVGWHGMADPDAYRVDGPLAESARRFEPGSLNMLGLAGLRAALELFGEVGLDAVAARLRELRQQLVDGLRDRGYEVPGADAYAWGPITGFHRDGTDIHRLAKRLAEHQVVTSVRRLATADGEQDLIRLAPHFYTTDSDLDRLWGAL